MNWDAIGAIAELLGALGVIASLIYLATQIRESREQMSQNTRAVRASTFQQFPLTVDSDTIERRLAAIVPADAVDYSWHMAEDKTVRATEP